jgi:hypothetical protein
VWSKAFLFSAKGHQPPQHLHLLYAVSPPMWTVSHFT